MSETALSLDVLRAERCVAIVRASSVDHLVATARILVEEGVAVLEFPLTTPGVLAALDGLLPALAGAHVGVGSVTTLAEAQSAAAAGAQFLVTPKTNPAVIEWCRRNSLSRS